MGQPSPRTETTHRPHNLKREARHSVASLHTLDGENPPLHTPRPWQKATMVPPPFEVHTAKSGWASVRLAQRKKCPQESFQECIGDKGIKGIAESLEDEGVSPT